MREGINPTRNKKNNEIILYVHRVIIPVYIPYLNDYYKDSFSIFKMSIDSLLLTTLNNKTAITIVNNGSCIAVVDYIMDLFQQGKIQEVINTEKIGKINSILKALKASGETFVTISDADVLFKNNWLNETFKVFENFKKAGVVGLVPQFKQYENLGYNVLFDNLFNDKVKFTDVKDPQELKQFYQSIGWDNSYNKDYLKYNLTIKSSKNSSILAIIGSGHFVATYKREYLDLNLNFTKFLLGGGTEHNYLDLPPVKKGSWRLTTNGNNAFHMGNKNNIFYINYFEKMKEDVVNYPTIQTINKNQIQDKKISFFLKQKLFKKIFKKRKRFFFFKFSLKREIRSTY